MPDEFEEHEAPDAKEVYGSSSDPYGSGPEAEAHTSEPSSRELIQAPLAPLPARKSPPPPPPPPPTDEEEDADGEETGMLRMSFMEHLEELRSRILKMLMGLVAAFVLSIWFCKDLWTAVQAPAVTALTRLNVHPPQLIYIDPMEGFNIIYIKLPILMSVFVGSPWVLYQVWGFISPGLYKREKRWAVPFILSTAGLFIAGGCFAYFVAFRYGLEFLLGIGLAVNVTPMVTIEHYFDLFVNVTLGVALVFELPVIIFFLTLLRLASPRFLIRHSRYAILAIVVLGAVVTPTPDAFNMMLFVVPMVALYFVGVFASYLLVLKREGKKLPWKSAVLVGLGLLAAIVGSLALLVYRYHYHFILKWPYLSR